MVNLGRPCPFFSRGNCLFAEACNFVHDVKVISPKRRHNIPQIYCTVPNDSSRCSPTTSMSEFALDSYHSSYEQSSVPLENESPALVEDVAGESPPSPSTPILGSPILLAPTERPKPSAHLGRRGPLLFLDELKQYQQRYISRPLTPQDVAIYPEKQDSNFALVRASSFLTCVPSPYFSPSAPP